MRARLLIADPCVYCSISPHESPHEVEMQERANKNTVRSPAFSTGRNTKRLQKSRKGNIDTQKCQELSPLLSVRDSSCLKHAFLVSTHVSSHRDTSSGSDSLRLNKPNVDISLTQQTVTAYSTGSRIPSKLINHLQQVYSFSPSVTVRPRPMYY